MKLRPDGMVKIFDMLLNITDIVKDTVGGLVGV